MRGFCSFVPFLNYNHFQYASRRGMAKSAMNRRWGQAAITRSCVGNQWPRKLGLLGRAPSSQLVVTRDPRVPIFVESQPVAFRHCKQIIMEMVLYDFISMLCNNMSSWKYATAKTRTEICKWFLYDFISMLIVCQVGNMLPLKLERNYRNVSI